MTNIFLSLKLKSRSVRSSKKNKKNISGTDEAPEKKYILITSSVTTLIYAFGLTIWQQATNFEVYSLQILLINLVIYFFIRAWQSNETEKGFYLFGAFLLGLSFTNHLTTILIVPALIFLYFKSSQKFSFSTQKFKFGLILLIPFILALSIYLYLPIRSSMQPDFNWGWVSRDFDKFWYHVSGKQYQVWMFSDSDAMKRNVSLFFQILPNQFGWIGILPLLLGIYWLIRTNLTYAIFLLLITIITFGYVINYSIHDIDSYFILVFIPLHLFVGVGLIWLCKFFKNFGWGFIIIPIISLFINYERCDLSKDFLVREYTKNLINNLEKDALIISAQWDYWCSAFWYMQKVEEVRTDIILVEKELLRRTWYPYQFKNWHPEIFENSIREFELFLEDLELFEQGKPYNPQRIQARFVNLLNSFIERNIKERPIYITLDVLQTEPDVGKNYEKIPEGFAIRLRDKRDIYKVSVDNFDLELFEKSFKRKENHLEEGIRKLASTNLAFIGNYALATEQFETARKSYEMSLRLDKTNHSAIQGIENANKRLQQ